MLVIASLPEGNLHIGTFLDGETSACSQVVSDHLRAASKSILNSRKIGGVAAAWMLSTGLTTGL